MTQAAPGSTPAAEDRRPEPVSPLQHSLRCVFVAWIFGAVWSSTVNGVGLIQYCKLLKMPNFGFGLLTSLSYAAALVQLAASFYLERRGHHKRLFIIAGMIHRFFWLPVALVPWFMPAPWWWPAALMLKLVCDLAGGVVTSVWFAWMADLVPSRIRGRFFSRRAQMGLFVQIVITLTVGLLLDWAMKRGDAVLLRTISAAFALAAISGTVDFLFFLPVPGPRSHRPDPSVGLLHLIGQPLRDPNFRRFLGFTGTLTLATAFLGPFFWRYLLEEVGMSNTMASVLMTLVPISIMMLTQRFWGRVIDRVGRKPVMVICGCVVTYGAVMWLGMTREHWVIAYVIIETTAIAWAGLELANFNMMLSLSESREGRHYGSAYSAIQSMVSAVAGILSGLLGGFIAQHFGDWRGAILGKPITYYEILFILSSLLRVAALPWLIGLKDTRVFTTRATLEYMAGDLLATFRQTLTLPVRLARRLGRTTYKLHERRRGRP